MPIALRIALIALDLLGIAGIFVWAIHADARADAEDARRRSEEH